MIIILFILALLIPSLANANISFVQLGTGGSGSGTVSATIPASGVVEGDILLMCIVNKPVNSTPGGGGGVGHINPTTPTNWTQIANNQGFGDDSSAPGTNDCCGTQMTVFYRIVPPGGLSGAVSSTITGGGSAHAQIIQYHNTTGTWSVAAAQGGDSTFGTDYSATMNVDPDITTDDMVVACHGKSEASHNSAITEAITTSGVTYDTKVERYENGTSLGDNSGVIIVEHPVLFGPSNGALSTTTYTYSGFNNLGGTVIMRLRQTGSVTPPPGCTITLGDASQTTVKNAIASADTGSTICLPNTTGAPPTWTTTTGLTPSVTINKGIYLLGVTTCTGNGSSGSPVSCTDGTVIKDGTDRTAGSDPLLITGTNARVSGISFQDARNFNNAPWNGSIDSGPMVKMQCNNCRVDHSSFTATSTLNGTYVGPHALLSVSYNGVDILGSQLIDHNYIRNMNNGVVVYGQTAYEVANSLIIGTQSWEHSLTLGDSLATYIEDNYFDFDQTYNGAYDSYYGARAVFRYNNVKNTNMGGHGYDSAARSTLRQEVYRNYISNPTNSSQPTVPTWWETRGGVHMVWDNTITTAGGSYAKHLTLVYYRSEPKGCPTCGEIGTTPPYKGICGEDMSGSANPADLLHTPTVTETPGNNYNGGNVGDGLTNWKDGNTGGQHGYPCRDQMGRGPASDPANDWPTKRTRADNPVYSQVLMPGYSWGNSFKGAAPVIGDHSLTASCVIIGCVNDDTRLTTYHYLQNRDFYIETAINSAHGDGTVGVGKGTLAQRPATCTTGVGYMATDQGSWNISGNGDASGVFYKCTSTNTWTVNYTPYTYPHPLNADPAPPLPTPPTGLRVLNSANSNSCSIVWNASSMSGLLGYHVYHGTSPGVYPIMKTVTTSTAIAAHTPLLQANFQLSVAGTHYFSVTSFNADGESGFATEVTCTSTGLSRSPSTVYHPR